MCPSRNMHLCVVSIQRQVVDERSKFCSPSLASIQFIIQSLMTTLLTSLVTRWTSPACQPRRVPRLAIAMVPTMAFIVALVSLFTPGGFENRYYLSMIVWWASLPLALLWWGTARSWAGILGRPKSTLWLACLLLPTVYLCSADVYALRRGTWHIAVSTLPSGAIEMDDASLLKSPLRILRKARVSASLPFPIYPSKKPSSSLSPTSSSSALPLHLIASFTNAEDVPCRNNPLPM